MKTLRIYLLAGLSVAVAGLNAHAALLNLGKDSGSSYFADFTANSLNVFYDYTATSAGNGSGIFRAFNPYSGGSVVAKGGAYESSSLSGGTGALNGGTGYNNQGFLGAYEITATINVVNGIASLASGGTVKVFGNLLGGSTGDLLLQGTLRSGLGGVAFGYVDPSSGLAQGKYDLFEFIFDVTGGNPAIVADYMGLGGTGGIILDANFDANSVGGYNGNNGSTTTTAMTTFSVPPPGVYQGFDGNWTKDFSNPLNAGLADTFVPEPATYALIGGVMALIGLVITRRKAVGESATLN